MSDPGLSAARRSVQQNQQRLAAEAQRIRMQQLRDAQQVRDAQIRRDTQQQVRDMQVRRDAQRLRDRRSGMPVAPRLPAPSASRTAGRVVGTILSIAVLIAVAVVAYWMFFRQ